MKPCICCGMVKPLSEFHKHPQMSDGHLNKCVVCVRLYVKEWKKDQGPGYSNKCYLRALEIGSATRVAPQKYGRDPFARKLAAARYLERRQKQTGVFSELDEFAFKEGRELARLRTKMLGVRWEVDHIIPFNYALASGLHNGYNLQCVPGLWNKWKGNRSMQKFWPIAY